MALSETLFGAARPSRQRPGSVVGTHGPTPARPKRCSISARRYVGMDASSPRPIVRSLHQRGRQRGSLVLNAAIGPRGLTAARGHDGLTRREAGAARQSVSRVSIRAAHIGELDYARRFWSTTASAGRRRNRLTTWVTTQPAAVRAPIAPRSPSRPTAQRRFRVNAGVCGRSTQTPALDERRQSSRARDSRSHPTRSERSTTTRRGACFNGIGPRRALATG